MVTRALKIVMSHQSLQYLCIATLLIYLASQKMERGQKSPMPDYTTPLALPAPSAGPTFSPRSSL